MDSVINNVKNTITNLIKQIHKIMEDGAEYLSREEVEMKIRKTRKAMEAAAKELDFIEAARLRDEMFAYQALLKK